MEKRDQLSSAFKEFREMRYPGACRGLSLYGIDLMLLDADMFQAIDLTMQPDVDTVVLNRLAKDELSIRMVLLGLTGYAYRYFERSRDIARMALDAFAIERGPEVHLVEAVIAEQDVPQDVIDRYRSVIDARAFNGYTALTAAARLGREDWCKALLDAGADPEATEEGDFTPFMGAVMSGQVGILEILTARGIDPKTQRVQDIPALSFAVSFEHEDVIAFLLDHGADPWITISEDMDLYEFLQRSRLYNIARLIAEARALQRS